MGVFSRRIRLRMSLTVLKIGRPSKGLMRSRGSPSEGKIRRPNIDTCCQPSVILYVVSELFYVWICRLLYCAYHAYLGYLMQSSILVIIENYHCFLPTNRGVGQSFFIMKLINNKFSVKLNVREILSSLMIRGATQFMTYLIAKKRGIEVLCCIVYSISGWSVVYLHLLLLMSLGNRNIWMSGDSISAIHQLRHSYRACTWDILVEHCVIV